MRMKIAVAIEGKPFYGENTERMDAKELLTETEIRYYSRKYTEDMKKEQERHQVCSFCS